MPKATCNLPPFLPVNRHTENLNLAAVQQTDVDKIASDDRYISMLVR